jgi:hypothetical protein
LSTREYDTGNNHRDSVGAERGPLHDSGPRPLHKCEKFVFYTLAERKMAEQSTVRATEFARNFARYQDAAIEAKVIVVTSHDRVVGAYLSARELARYERLKAREREVLVVGELSDDLVADIEAAEYGKQAR